MTSSAETVTPPEPLTNLVKRLYPICRSITGDGLRETLNIIGEQLPLEVLEVPSGTQVFDWTVPDEWNIRSAYFETLDGDRIVDFSNHNLHILNYSSPVESIVDRDELDQHLYSIPEHPDWIPYRTSYYSKNWGFCLTQRQRDSLKDDAYRVVIDSDLAPGSLTYGECFIPGRTDREVVIYTHVCHPSLCNDNLTGIAIAASLGRFLRDKKNYYSYRLVFAPGTIGAITWLSQNRANLGKIAHGLVIGLLGDDAPFTYKRTRQGSSEIDDVASHVLGECTSGHSEIDFGPYGYDERQFGSPGLNLPFGRLTRSGNGEYDAYHSSGDDLSIISEARMQESLEVLMSIIDTLESNRHYINLVPNCEPQLGKRGLYRTTGGMDIVERESAILWLLNQSDGDTSMLSIARKSGISMEVLDAAARELCDAQLLVSGSDQNRITTK